MNLVDRVLRTAWRLVFILILLAVAGPMLVALIAAGFHSLGGTLSGVGGLLCVGLIALFALGIAVRVGRALRSAAAEFSGDRGRGSRPRASSRRRAENVPGYGRRERLPEDPDPGLEV